MSYVTTKGKFHVALDGVGLLLQGAPSAPGYKMTSAPVYGQRFASGDRDYNDLSQWWYLIQTDWSAGRKDDQSWLDDAKYYYSTNIDTWSEPGAIKLAKDTVLEKDFSEDVSCGANVDIAGTSYQVVGTYDNASNRPVVYRAPQGVGQTWTDISTTTIDTNQNVVSQLSSSGGTLWTFTVGVGATDVVLTYNGTSWVDQSAFMHSVLAHQTGSARCAVDYQGVKYIFSDDTANSYYACVKTAVVTPSMNADYTKVFDQSNDAGIPISACVIDGVIYYLLSYTTRMELWAYDIAGAVRTQVRVFNNTSPIAFGVANKYLVNYNGLLIITIPANEIWSYDGTTLKRIYLRDNNKNAVLAGSLFIADYISYGCVISDNKCWWGNLMYDGIYFHNTYKFNDDGTSPYNVLYSNINDVVMLVSTVDDSKMYYVSTTAYKGADEKNYLILNNFDKISGIDKLPYSLTILFKPLATGQSIEIEYFLGEMIASPTWVSLGTASATLDGTTVRDKQFLFPVGTTFKKIWFRVKLEGGGSDTPTMTDFVMEYLPMPNYRKEWSLRINCADELKTLDGSLVETTARELKSRLETMWWTKSVLDFEDVDYATTLLNGAISDKTATTITVDDTYDFPEQGKLRVDDEEIIYTSKTPTTFVGCTRGARGSRATTHSDNAVINNAYKVLLVSVDEQTPIVLKGKELEYVVGLQLREA